MPEEYITRSEYEAREDITRQSMVRLESKIDSINNKLDIQKDNKLVFIKDAGLAFVGGGGLMAIIEFLVRK